MSAAIVATGARSCLVSSWRISHLGINPVRGGRPPRDRRIRGVRAVRAGVLAQEVARELIVVALFSLKVRNVDRVITRYVIRARRVRVGENCRIRIIHPRWAIEEYAKIFRSCVWFSPPQPPIRVDVRPSNIMVVEFEG